MSLNDFLNNFIKRKGISVGISSIIEKIGGFLLIIIATRLLSKNQFGLLTYANTTLVFLIPFIGFGVHQALIRYGSLSNSQIDKKKLFIFTLKKGLIFSLIITLLVIITAPLLTINLKGAKIYLLILSFQLVSLFMFEMIRIYSRLLNLNKLYSQITNVKTFFLVALAFFLSINWGSIGYALALSVVPFLISILYLKKLKLIGLNKDFTLNISFKKFFLYGFYTSLGGVLSQLLYAVDVLMIGNVIREETVIALYKVSNILPFSILILPIIFIKTDFVLIANKSKIDKEYIKNYYINYLKLFSIISLLILLFFYVFSSELMLLFGSSYNDNSLIMIFVIGVVGALLLRIPLGNMLSAVGLAKINALNSLLILMLNITFSYIFIIKFGVVGAAIVTASLMWFSGFLSLFFFIKFIKK